MGGGIKGGRSFLILFGVGEGEGVCDEGEGGGVHGARVDGGDDREVVLEAVEVVGSCG